MIFENEAWFTINEDLFQEDAYIYHYTTVEKASLILNGMCLKFSKLTELNDTAEAKPKLKLNVNPKKIESINNYLQILCFSRDRKAHTETINGYDSEYSDYTGRGFALPRTWAQYANNNDGVCFVFRRKTLEALVNVQLNNRLIKIKDVEYVSQFKKLAYKDPTIIEKNINNLKKPARLPRYKN